MKAEEFLWKLFALGESSFAYLYHESISDLIEKDLKPDGLDLVQSKANKDNPLLAKAYRTFTNTRKNKEFYENIKELTGKNGFLIWEGLWEYLVNKDRDKIIIFNDFASEDFVPYKPFYEENKEQQDKNEKSHYHLNVDGAVPMEYTQHREDISEKIAQEDDKLRNILTLGLSAILVAMIASSLLLSHHYLISLCANVFFVASSFTLFYYLFKKRNKDRDILFDELTERDLDIQNVILQQLFPQGRNYSAEEIEYDKMYNDFDTNYLKVRINPFIKEKSRIKRLKTMIEHGFSPIIYQHINAVDVFEVVTPGKDESHLIKKTKYGEPLEVYKYGNAVLILDDDLENSLLLKRWINTLDMKTLDIPQIIEEYLEPIN